MNDFKEKNGLSLPKATYRWTKKSLEKFYMENKLILTSGRYLLPYTKIESY